MNEPRRRRRSTRRQRRARGFDLIINLCLVLAAVLAALPWLFLTNTDAEPVATRDITAATNHGATR